MIFGFVRPWVTSFGHSILESRDHRVKIRINERSEWVRVRYLIKLSLKAQNKRELGFIRYFIRKGKAKLNPNNINIEQVDSISIGLRITAF